LVKIGTLKECGNFQAEARGRSLTSDRECYDAGPLPIRLARAAAMRQPTPVIVVSGLPRSGTSLVMQMLQAGGVPVLTDHVRTADDDNPRGYLEYEPVKRIRSDKTWLEQAPGKAVKIVHLLLMDLPADHEYRVVMLRRDPREVARSQAAMLERGHRRGASLSPEKLMAVFEAQMSQVRQWLASQPNFRVLEVDYAEIIRDPAAQAGAMAAFLEQDLDIDAMAAVVDPRLYRNKV
jgi:hypothetical protein